MRKVAVTGGAGRLGKYIVQDFLQHGWAVLSIDVVPEGATTTNADAEIAYVPESHPSCGFFAFGYAPA